MHALRKAGWFESAHYFYLYAGRDERFVISLHRLHRLWIGRHTVFGVFGRFAKNHDFHDTSPGWTGFSFKDGVRTSLPTMENEKTLDAAIVGARPRAMAALLRYFRDLDTAEEAFQEACL